MPNKNKNTEMPQCVQTDVTSRTFKCLKCKNYSVKVINEKGGTSRVCNAKTNDPRVIMGWNATTNVCIFDFNSSSFNKKERLSKCSTFIKTFYIFHIVYIK